MFGAICCSAIGGGCFPNSIAVVRESIGVIITCVSESSVVRVVVVVVVAEVEKDVVGYLGFEERSVVIVVVLCNGLNIMRRSFYLSIFLQPLEWDRYKWR